MGAEVGATGLTSDPQVRGSGQTFQIVEAGQPRLRAGGPAGEPNRESLRGKVRKMETAGTRRSQPSPRRNLRLSHGQGQDPVLPSPQAASSTTFATLTSPLCGLARSSITATSKLSHSPPRAYPPRTSLSQCAPR
jgi:hypothetical protein